MSMCKFTGVRMGRLWCSTLAAGLLVLTALFQGDCRADSVQKMACINISGNLTLKGSEPGAWWALADDQGRIWKITLPTPEQLVIFEKAQNQRIGLQGRRLGKYLNFEQIQPCHIITGPAP